MTDSTRYIDVVDVAKMVRAALRKRWPEVTFSVRSDRYAGGASIDVSWTDGPTEADVMDVVGRYQGSTFDGMRDLQEYHTTLLATEDDAVEEVHMGADFIHTKRRYSPDLARKVAADVAETWDMDPVPVKVRERDGTGYLAPDGRRTVRGSTCRTIADETREALAEHDATA